jgi:hypothetical protein
LRVSVIASGLGQGLLHLTQLPALLSEFVGKGEGATLPRLVGGKPPLVLSQPQAITFPLLFEPVKRVLEPGDGTERSDRDGEIDLVIGASALEQCLIVVIIAPAKTLAVIDEIEAPDLCDVDFTLERVRIHDNAWNFARSSLSLLGALWPEMYGLQYLGGIRQSSWPLSCSSPPCGRVSPDP